MNGHSQLTHQLLQPTQSGFWEAEINIYFKESAFDGEAVASHFNWMEKTTPASDADASKVISKAAIPAIVISSDFVNLFFLMQHASASKKSEPPLRTVRITT